MSVTMESKKKKYNFKKNDDIKDVHKRCLMYKNRLHFVVHGVV